MEYEKKSFTVPFTSQAYADNWEACFGKKRKEPKCVTYGAPATEQVPVGKD